MGCCMAAG